MQRVTIPEAIADLLAPPRCPACASRAALAPGVGICGHCRTAFAAEAPRSLTLPGGLPAVAAVAYEPPATGLVAALKSGRVPGASAAAVELVAEAVRPPGPNAVLVPVGASRRRRLQRGLDPAAELARGLARAFGCGCRPGLLRRRGGRPQRGRSRAARLASPPRFEVRERPLPRSGEPVVLVDDVITTGATLGSCAAALRDVGIGVAGAVAFAWAPAPGSGRRRA